jgi:MoaD family protein
MTITVEIGFSFKHEVGASEMTLELPEGSYVLTALNELARLFSHIKGRLFANSGEVHRHINALINGENVSFRNGFATVLRDGDRLTLLPPVGGG